LLGDRPNSRHDFVQRPLVFHLIHPHRCQKLSRQVAHHLTLLTAAALEPHIIFGTGHAQVASGVQVRLNRTGAEFDDLRLHQQQARFAVGQLINHFAEGGAWIEGQCEVRHGGIAE
jgi:hypothetical protein